jgi:uncharacterized phage-associated protein
MINIKPTSREEKFIAFEYFLLKLLQWSESQNSNGSINDLSILKALKLLFLVSAADTLAHKNNSLLTDVFNNVHAMPLGHVESDIYNYIRTNNGNLKYFKIDSKQTYRKEGFEDLYISQEITRIIGKQITSRIDEALLTMNQVNPNIINYSASELVELSHLWYSWRKGFEEAKKLSKASLMLNIDDIVKEDKIFNFKSF